jgi:hypothetical protein
MAYESIMHLKNKFESLVTMCFVRSLMYFAYFTVLSRRLPACKVYLEFLAQDDVNSLLCNCINDGLVVRGDRLRDLKHCQLD